MNARSAAVIVASGLLALCVVPVVVAGEWVDGASMGVTREYPGLAVLPDGRIQAVTGHALSGKGLDPALRSGLASAELYDPVRDVWMPTGALRVRRNGVQPEGLIRLASDKVLFAGGGSGSRSVHEVELYDPETGKWELTGPMSVPRCVHTTTLLETGQVLAVGGIDWITEEVRDTAEVYDPETGEWRFAGRMRTPRFSHRAIRLSDGRVLVMGGHNAYPGFEPVTADAEIFDPATGEWQKTSPMKTARRSFGAVLLDDGRVLVVGGASGSRNVARQLEVCEVFDPKTETWTAVDRLREARWGPTVNRLADGRVLVTGGGIGPFGARSSAELFDPASGTWSNAGRLRQARNGHRSIMMPDGRLLIAGGHYVGTYLSSCEIYVP